MLRDLIRTFSAATGATLTVLVAVACQPVGDAGEPGHESTESREAAEALSATGPMWKGEIALPWGADTGQLGLTPARIDQASVGPQSLAISPDGSVWVLDQVNERVVQIDPQGQWASSHEVPWDAIDVAVGPDGDVAVMSLVSRQIKVFAASGVVEEIPVPIHLREVSRFSIDRTGRILLETSKQDTFDLGRAGARIGWPDILSTQVAGIGHQLGGEPIQSLVRDGSATLLLSTKGSRAQRKLRLASAGSVGSAVVLGSLPNGQSIMQVQRFADDGTLENTLQLVGPDGETIHEHALGQKHYTHASRRIAVSAAGSVVVLNTTVSGVRLQKFELGGAK